MAIITFVADVNKTVTVQGDIPTGPSLTINNGQNMKSIQYGTNTYTQFPVQISLPNAGPQVITANGEDDKIITVDYQNTQVPVVTNT